MYGYNLVAIDTKGRISLPSKYRESLKDFEASKIIITRDPQYPSLKLYPKKTWDYISSNLISLQTLDPIVRKLQWTILGNASVINFDLNNRMNALISSDLREYAELNNEKKVVLIGMGDKFEIWNSENWDARQTSSALSCLLYTSPSPRD